MKKPIRAMILTARKGIQVPRYDLPEVLYPVGGKAMIKYLTESFGNSASILLGLLLYFRRRAMVYLKT